MLTKVFTGREIKDIMPFFAGDLAGLYEVTLMKRSVAIKSPGTGTILQYPITLKVFSSKISTYAALEALFIPAPPLNMSDYR